MRIKLIGSEFWAYRGDDLIAGPYKTFGDALEAYPGADEEDKAGDEKGVAGRRRAR
jgi:hypothetical protein